MNKGILRGICLLLSLSLPTCQSGDKEEAKRPNIIYILIVCVLIFLQGFSLLAQDLVWHNPLNEESPVLEGQGWENIAYYRLPNDAKDKVREPVWNLSRDAAGIMLRFYTDAKEIWVKYTPGGELQMPHMPATGDSGLDLYTKDESGNWAWVRGEFSFESEVSYRFFAPEGAKNGRVYQLYLPLYNSVHDLQIGVGTSDSFSFKEKRREAPIVVYGTSIAQGACASRPGMAWTNIVGRTLDVPVINLGFSGNGKLEKELIEYIKTIDAKVYILDCLPNLGPGSGLGEEVIKQRILMSVHTLREAHPDTPILLVEHAGYSDGMINPERRMIYSGLNSWMEECFEKLRKEKINNLFILTHKEIGMGMDV